MSRIVERAWDALIKKIAKERDISADEAEELMQECLYQLADFYDGKTHYFRPEAILDDYLGLPGTYLWVFRWYLDI